VTRVHRSGAFCGNDKLTFVQMRAGRFLFCLVGKNLTANRIVLSDTGKMQKRALYFTPFMTYFCSPKQWATFQSAIPHTDDYGNGSQYR
jgi:hypothetical protein